MNFTIINIQYHPNADSVAVLIQNDFCQRFVVTTQTALQVRTAEGMTWGDEECLAEAQAAIDLEWPGIGYTVSLPEVGSVSTGNGDELAAPAPQARPKA